VFCNEKVFMNLSTLQFLSQSRQTPELFDKKMTMALDEQTSVSIFAPGIIQFEPVLAQAGIDAQRNTLKAPKSIVLSCGIHGNETAPIEICDAIVQDLLAGKLSSPHRLLFIFGNLPAMDIAERFVEENLNRLFNTNESEENMEQKRAQVIKQAVAEFFDNENKPSSHVDTDRYHYDLHTAIRESKNEKFAVYPFLHGQAYNKDQLRFLSACGVNTILLSQSPTSTFSYYTSYHYYSHSFTVELGKVRPFGENKADDFAAVTTRLRQLISSESLDLPAYQACPLEVFEVKQVIDKSSNDFRLSFSDDTPNFMDFTEGALLAVDGDIKYTATQDGEAIVFPNANVAIGQRALLTVVPCEL
jgi:succinylglutamate desuccinylase